MDYFIALGGTQQGPFPIDQLLTRGLKPDTLIWRSGMAQWQRADSVVELQAIFAPPPPRPEYSASTVPPAPPFWQGPPGAPPFARDHSKRVLVGVLALLFGSLGIHKFAMGMVGTGLIMLLTSVLTLGLGCLVMHPIAFVEGIIYLSKSDEEFHQAYIVERRNWF